MVGLWEAFASLINVFLRKFNYDLFGLLTFRRTLRKNRCYKRGRDKIKWRRTLVKCNNITLLSAIICSSPLFIESILQKSSTN